MLFERVDRYIGLLAANGQPCFLNEGEKATRDTPGFQILQALHESIKVYGIGRVEIIFIAKCFGRLLRRQRLVKGILYPSVNLFLSAGLSELLLTIDMMTTQGRLRDATIARASEVLPEPELPAIPIMLVSAHGGV